MASYRFEVYQDISGEWRWRLKSSNGRIVADGSEGYDSKRNCVAGLNRVLAQVPNASMEVVEDEGDET